MGQPIVRVSLEYVNEAQENAVMSYATNTQLVTIRGALYPRELELANAIVRLLKTYHRDGSLGPNDEPAD